MKRNRGLIANKGHPEHLKFNAVVLAGERKKKNDLLEGFQVPVKALIPVKGRPMAERVIQALVDSQCIEKIFLCGPDRALFEGLVPLSKFFHMGRIVWVQNENSPSASALKAMRQAGDDKPVLVTTADHALLKPNMIQYFCRNAGRTGLDLVVGLARLEIVQKCCPGIKRTSYKFRDGSYCSCNLFGFMNRQAFKAAEFWQKAEEKRKHPLKIVATFGWYWVVRYLLGAVDLSQAFDRVSKVIGCTAGPLILPFPQAAIDVDTLQDWKMAERII
ncbi:MAG: MobA-like NTP transferase domain containing protein [Thermodesulfatator sp.]|nr:MAG: MobA-like NTP transferase domain containing protein [Thermodesulfatator sp.]